MTEKTYDNSQSFKWFYNFFIEKKKENFYDFYDENESNNNYIYKVWEKNLRIEIYLTDSLHSQD